MQFAIYAFAFLFSVQDGDLHRFPSERYSLDTYWGLKLSIDNAIDLREFISLWKCKEAWSVLHSAWACEGKRKYLVDLRYKIGWQAYERGEMPRPPIRIIP